MKKAQIQMGESIFVIIIILLLIIFGIVFSSRAEKDQFQTKNKEFLDLSTITLSEFAISLSELQCSTLEVRDLSCFDKNKLEAFKNVTDNHRLLSREYYFSQLGNANITVVQIFPEAERWEVYYNGFPEDTKYDQNTVLLPISIYDGVTKKYGFGIAYITKYKRRAIV